MAGEQKGKTYEAVVSVVLNRLKTAGKIKQDIFWNERPAGMTIEPDFTIGPDKDHPSQAFLITHSGSAKESEKKQWRNLGELVELKVFIQSQPRVFNIAFDSVIKEGLKKVQAAAFDGQLIVGDKSYGPGIQKWVEQNQSKLPREAKTKAAEIEIRLKTDKTLKPLIQSLQSDIDKLLKQQNKQLNTLWSLERNRSKGKAPSAKVTFIRRGLSKAFLIGDSEIILSLFNHKSVPKEKVRPVAVDLGIVSKSIGGFRIADDESINAVKTLVANMIMKPKKVLDKCISDASAGFINQLVKVTGLPLLNAYEDYVMRHYDSLITKTGMRKHLEKLYLDPNDGLDLSSIGIKSENLWLFDFIGALIKASSAQQQGFGYSTFSKHPDSASEKIGEMNVGTWVSCFMNQYFSRAQNFNPPATAINHTAKVLSNALSEVKKVKIRGLKGKVRDAFVAKEVEATLLAHRGFDPIRVMIELVVNNVKKTSIRSCFAEAAQLGGAAGKTTVLQSKTTLINWQSCHGSHTNDKKKELCGRAVALRYSWDASTKKFIPRAGVKKLILVVDGTWRQKDLDALARAGWDEIFYPDEMDKLKKSVI